jgi:hypothetical protein
VLQVNWAVCLLSRNFEKRVDAAYKKFRNRAPLIYVAIAFVTLGGVFEFVAAVFLGG